MECILETRFARTYIPLKEVNWRIVFALIALNTICLTFYRQLNYVANASHRSLLLTFSEEAAGGIAGFLVFPLIYLAAIRFPLISTKWRSYLLLHLLAVCLISVVHTSIIALLRVILFPILGFPTESYGYMPARYPMEFSHLFIYYWVTLSFIYLFHEIRFAREREVAAVKLESSLTEARLQNLRLQLEPHFLFNALNAISAALYEDPRVADEMIGRLGELLRQLLRDDRSQFVCLARELEILQLYTEIMKARFEDRLTICIEMDDSLGQALVPQLIFQPLVENAIRYGMDSSFAIRIDLDAWKDGEWLHLRVRDHGPGLQKTTASASTTGIGLRNTRERLAQLYGNQQAFRIDNAEDGGAIVELCLPLRWEAGQHQHAPSPSTVQQGVA